MLSSRRSSRISLRRGAVLDRSGPELPKLTRAATYVGSAVVEDRQVELAEALVVGDQVNFDDLAARDREAEYAPRPPARSPHESHGSVHERRLCGPGTPREGVGHGRRTADLTRCARMHGRAVGSEHDVWVEHREKRVEVTAARGSKEGVDNFSLAGDIVGNRDGSLHPAACAVASCLPR
jgi:hypothetical protein